MESNKIDPDKFIEQIKYEFGEDVFKKAVLEFEQSDILFEGQFPFLTDASMRDKNFSTLRTILEKYGFFKYKDVHGLAFEIPPEGWMHYIAVFGGHFNAIDEIKRVTIDYFSNTRMT